MRSIRAKMRSILHAITIKATNDETNHHVQLQQTIDDLLESQRIAHLGTWRLDVATNQVVWSDELYRMYGFDPTIPPPPYTEHMKLFTPESWSMLSASLDRTATEGIPYELELETVRKDGSTGWMWVRGEALKDADGAIVSLRGAAQDITTRKRLERQLIEGEERFHALFNQAPLGYQSLDIDGNFIEVNQKWLDTLGYGKEEVIGKWFGDFLCPEYVEGFRQRFPLFRAQGYIHSEFEMVSKDGRRLFIAFDGKIGYTNEGEFKQTHCILQDVTEQRAIERALQQSEERYRHLFEYSGVGIAYYTPDGRVISYNKKSLENIGGTLEDYVGKSISEISPPEMASMLLGRIEASVSDDISHEYVDFMNLYSGPKWFSSTVTNIKDSSGTIVGVQVASLDITERVHAEQALQESQTILNAAFESSQVGILIADVVAQKLRYINKSGLSILGKALDELDKDIAEHRYDEGWGIFHLDGSALGSDEIPLRGAVSSGQSKSGEYLLRSEGCADRFIFLNAVPVLDPNNRIIAGVAVLVDVTEQKIAEKNVRKQNDLFSSLLRLLPVGVFMVDARDGKPLVANEKAKDLLGRGILPDADERSLSEVYQAYKGNTTEHYPPSEMPITLGMKGVSAHIEDMVVERPDNTRVLLEVFGTPVLDEQSIPWASLVTFMDITERKRAENELAYMAYHDLLTGLHNRRFFEEELHRIDQPQNLPLSIIMCDVNGLKLVNDSFGHEAGDVLLSKAADAIRKACPANSVIARIGGDEYAVILPRTSSVEAKDILTSIETLASSESISNVELSISCGHETKTSEGQELSEIVATAENYMYRHKLYIHKSVKSKAIDLILKTLFEKSQREAQHSVRVSKLCEIIATSMDLDRETIGRAKAAGLIHDIGKIGIDEGILNKPSQLDDYEWNEIKKHPEIGWRILSASNEFFDLANLVLNHHERWDGTGYPNGISKDAIPIEAHIIALADAFDAMTSKRSYRSAMSEESALAEIKRCAGTQFSPEVVDAFVRVYGTN